MTLVTMNMNEVSMLSDDLRPRDTPNHTLFKDFVLKPIVPDLSITEVPASRAQFSPPDDPRQGDAFPKTSYSNGLHQQRPLLQECKTYSEWRRKSNPNANVTPASNFILNNPYNHFIDMGENFGAISKHTVLDSLYNSSPVGAFDKQPMLSPGARQSSVKEPGIGASSSQMTHEISKKCSNQLETRARSAEPKRKESARVSGDKETSYGATVNFHSKRSNSRSDSGSMGHHLSKSNKHYGNQPQISECLSCSHWPHQPMTTHSCNSMPVCNSFPHGLPSCSVVPRNLGMKPVPSPASANASRNFIANSAHPHSDSIIYDNLYQIVLSQSEQLRSLQTQVEKLLVSQEHKTNGSFENSRSRCLSHEHCSCSTTFVEKSTQTSDSEVNLKDNEKMSIGVMTSFVHTVAYAGCMEVVDSRGKGTKQTNMNVNSERGNKMANGKSCTTSACPPSQPAASSVSWMRNDTPSATQTGSQNKCCKCCHCNGVPDVPDFQMDPLEEALGGKKPGVSAAIRAVRGCQEVLATVSNACQAAEVDESITLNGVDMPTVVEPPVSPPSSIHVDMQDYHSSSSDQDESSCTDDQSSSIYSEDEDEQLQTPDGWTFYQNVLGQVNQLLEDKDKDGGVSKTSVEPRYSGKKKTWRERKESRKSDTGTGTHSDAVQVNSVFKRVAFQQECKRSEDDSTDSFKQLALNYLRENHPEELASSKGYTGLKTPSGNRRVQDVALYNVGNNMSFATFRYLDRYNLLPENFKLKTRIEELPGYTGEGVHVERNTDNRAMLTNSPLEANRSPFGKRNPINVGNRIQHGNACQSADSPSNGRHFKVEDISRHRGRNKAAKARHRRHLPQANVGNSVPADGSHGQENASAPTYKILDITALRQQPKLL